ncbi:hypothetical protein, partial [Parafrankia sp. EUN1f]
MTRPGPVVEQVPAAGGPGLLPYPFSGAQFRHAMERRLAAVVWSGEAPLQAAVVGTMRGALQIALTSIADRELGDARFALRQVLVAETIGHGYDLVGYARPDRTGAALAYRIVAVALAGAADLAGAELAR